MTESRKQQDSFENELEGRLNKLSHRKSCKQLSEKNQFIYQANYQIDVDKNDRFERIQKNRKLHKGEQLRLSNHDTSVRNNESSSEDEKLGRKARKESSNSKSYRKNKNELFALITNEELLLFIQENMGTNIATIDTSFFLAKCLSEFSPQKELPEEQIKRIFLEIQSETTTTDPNVISINALEMSIKKKTTNNSLRAYIADKVICSMYEIKKEKYDNMEKEQKRKEREFENYIENKNAEILKEQENYNKKIKNIEDRDKELIKKEKCFAAKEKEFQERVKNSKKMIEERANKLTEEYKNQISVQIEKTEKKMQTYERNMKYKIESLNHKINEVHQEREVHEEDIKNSAKRETEIRLEKGYVAKIKKITLEIKELKEKCEELEKQLRESEHENNKLMKVCGKLESKTTKEESKIKELIKEIENKALENRDLQFLCQSKQKENEEILNKMLSLQQNYEYEHINNTLNSSKHSRLEIKERETENWKESQISSKSNKSLSTKKRVHSSNTVPLKSPEKSSLDLPIEFIIETYEQIILNVKSENDELFALHRKTIQSCMEMSVRGFNCQNLIEYIYLKTIGETLSFGSNNKEKSSKYLTGLENEGEKIEAEFFAKHIQKLIKKKDFPIIYYISLSRLCILLFLYFKQENGFIWLKMLLSLFDNSSVEDYFYREVGEKEVCQSFILALLVKVLKRKAMPNIEIIDLISDLILNSKILANESLHNFWQNEIGLKFVHNFAVLAETAIREKSFFQENIENIEKMSIIVQRLMVGHEISGNEEIYNIFIEVCRKCSGSMLEKNLKSVLENYNVKYPLLDDLEEEENGY